MTCNDTCIHFPVCEQKKYDFANIDECEYYREERPKGKWEIIYGEHIRAGLRPIMYACDVCGVVGSQTNFCPNCGADMRGEE